MTSGKIILLVAAIAAFATFGALHLHSQKKPSSFRHHSDPLDIDEYQLRMQEFKEWTNKYDKNYNKLESGLRFKTWNDNYNFIQEYNAKNLSVQLGLNQFSDLSLEEFAALHLGLLPEVSETDESTEVDLSDVNAPANWDWASKGAVGHVKNQGSCGGCYSFAATGAMEGLYKIKKGSLITMSNQQAVDCSSRYGNQGCNGGLMTYVYNYMKASGIERASDYPWDKANRQGTCKYNSKKVLFKNTGFATVRAAQMLDAAYINPLSIGIAAASRVFQSYRSGILETNSGCGTNLDHAVLITAYTTSGNSTVWKIRNSWATTWGEKGYVRIRRTTSGAGVCGINGMVSYPTGVVTASSEEGNTAFFGESPQDAFIQ